jgi:hypothetical protein
MGTAVRPAKTSSGPWNAFADVGVFVDEVLVELAVIVKDGAPPMRSGERGLRCGPGVRLVRACHAASIRVGNGRQYRRAHGPLRLSWLQR